MKNKLYQIHVVLSREGIIMNFDSTLRGTKYGPSDVIGKNWFDTFIECNDKETVLKAFNDLFDKKNEKLETFENDIRCMDGSHKLIDFTNEVILINGQKYLSSVGVEHMDYCKQ